MEDDASGEDIADCVTFRVHVFDVDDLWCNKAGSSAPHEQVFLFICVSGESEIADGEIKAVFLPEHDVLGFEISVYDILSNNCFESYLFFYFFSIIYIKKLKQKKK